MGNKNKTTSRKRNNIKMKCFYCTALMRKDHLNRHNETVRCWAKPYMNGDYVPPYGDLPCKRCRQWCNGGTSCDELLPNLEKERRFKCPFCPQRFDVFSDMKIHVKSKFKSEAVSFKTVECFRCFEKIPHDDYLTHLHSPECFIHPELAKRIDMPYPCVKCGCFFRNMEHHKLVECKRMSEVLPINQHTKKVQRNTALSCFYCHKSSRGLKCLRNHIKTVRCWAKPYMNGLYVPPEGDLPCTRCRQWCNGGTSCDELLPNLEKEKIFKCPFCPKRFNNVINIKKHFLFCFSKSGAKTKTFNCFRCLKVFNRDEYLFHLNNDFVSSGCFLHPSMIKKNVFPYPCVFCGCFFRDMKSHKCKLRPLKDPMEKIIEDSSNSFKKFRCNECPFKANTTKTLRDHKMKKHPNYSRLSTLEKRKLSLRLNKQLRLRYIANFEKPLFNKPNEPAEHNQREATPEPTFSKEKTPDGDSTVKEEIPELTPSPTNSSPVQDTLELNNPRVIFVKPKNNNTKKKAGFPKSSRRKQIKIKLPPTLHMQNRKHYQCRKCKAIFTRLSTMTQHVRVCKQSWRDNPVLKDPRVPCMYCFASLPNSNKLKEHLRESECRFTTDPASGHCPHCDVIVQGDAISADSHFSKCKMRDIVAPGKEIRCNGCNWKYVEYREHLADYNSRCRNEFRQSGFTCGMCSFVGQEAIIMVEHCKLVHKIELSPTYVVNKGEFYCFVCGEKYDNEFNCRLDARDCMRTHGYACKTTNKVCSADIDVE